MGTIPKSRACCLLAGLFLLTGIVFQSSALTFMITETNDTTSFGSLREAILEANWFGGNNTILLGVPEPAGAHKLSREWVYHLTLSGAGETNSKTGDLNITRGSLTIIGESSDVTIDATALGDRVFQVGPEAHLTLKNLIITGGTAAGKGSAYYLNGADGGAIYNAGTLILEDCLITNNFSGNGNFLEGNGFGTSAGDGGAVFNLGTATLTDCTVAGNATGLGADGGFGGDGGGLQNLKTMVLNNCLISGNAAGNGGAPAGNVLGLGGNGGNGGGLANSGQMTLSQCIVSDNESGSGADGGGASGSFGAGYIPGGIGGSAGNGAGIFNHGNLKLNDCTISGNTTGSGGSGTEGDGYGGNAGTGGSGAGIFNTSVLKLNTCTISGNVCGHGGNGGPQSNDGSPSGGDGGFGGGIYNSGWLNSTSCTVVLNITGAAGNGGDGLSYSPRAEITVGGGGGNGGVAGNGGNGGNGGSGGGIYSDSLAVSNVLRNTLVALNSANVGGLAGSGTNNNSVPVGVPGANGVGPDLAGDFSSKKFNLIGIADGSVGFTNGVNADEAGSLAAPVDPLLGPLQMNGGPTPTHALLPGSPAIDQGSNFGIRTDQRGLKRPYNFANISHPPGGNGTDIGAYELGAGK